MTLSSIAISYDFSSRDAAPIYRCRSLIGLAALFASLKDDILTRNASMAADDTCVSGKLIFEVVQGGHVMHEIHVVVSGRETVSALCRTFAEQAFLGASDLLLTDRAADAVQLTDLALRAPVTP